VDPGDTSGGCRGRTGDGEEPADADLAPLPPEHAGGAEWRRARLAPLAEAATRILTIAAIDDQLRNQPATAPVEMRGAIRAIGELARTMQGAAVQPVTVSYHLEPLSLPPDLAVQCGLVVNELVTNALQHGFKGKLGGQVDVRAHARGGRVTLVVQDDGIGPSPEAVAGGTAGLGRDLVRLLVTRQLHGEFAIDASGGTRCRVTFPYPSSTAPADPA